MDQAAIRKAAILIATADRQTADALLERLEPEQAAAVRRCVVQLQDVDNLERDDVLSEFAESRVIMPATPAAAYAATSRLPQSTPQPVNRLVPLGDPAGIDLGSDAVIQLRIPGQILDEAATQKSNTAAAEGPFISIENAEPRDLAQFLSCEHPQTVAVVFSHLQPSQAATVLQELSADKRADVLERLTRLDETDEETIQEVERGLQAWLTEQVKRTQRRRAGMSAVAKIIEAGSADFRRELLADLADRDVGLANQVHPNAISMTTSPATDSRGRAPLTLEQISRLNSSTLFEILDTCDRDTLVFALAGAEPETVSDLLGVVGLADGRELRAAIANLGPVRLADVDAGQQRLGELAAARLQPQRIDERVESTFARAV